MMQRQKCRNFGRGTREWTKGQQSWISVTNGVRGGAKGTIGIVSGMPVLWNPFFGQKKKLPVETNITHMDTSSSLIGYKQGRLFSRAFMYKPRICIQYKNIKIQPIKKKQRAVHLFV